MSLIDMNGWHTASAIYYSDVNKAIAASATVPESFTETSGSVSVTANFGSWELTTGGSGPLIDMNLGITGGTETISNDDPYTIAACTATIQIKAVYIPQPDNDTTYDLTNDSTTAVSVVNLTTCNDDIVVQSTFQTLLQSWLNDNLDKFYTVFATVDLDAVYDTEGLSWLKPSFKGYAVAEPAVGATLENSVFAVMCLIDNATNSTGLTYQVDTSIIPSTTDISAGFVIAQSKFLQHMMMLAVPQMFKGITNDDPTDHFTINNGGTRIMNTTELTAQDVTLDNGKTVTPSVDAKKFTLQLDGTELEIAITDMTMTVSAGITLHLNYSGRATIFYDTDNDILDLAVTTESGNGSIEVSQGLSTLNAVLEWTGVALSLLGAFGGAVSKTASAAVTSATEAAMDAGEAVGQEAAAADQVTVSTCKGIISGTAESVSKTAARFMVMAKVALVGAFVTELSPAITGTIDAVANSDYDSMPKISDLTSSAVGKTIIWPSTAGTFTLASAQLNGPLQFGLKSSSSDESDGNGTTSTSVRATRKRRGKK
ncbi:hypothetical protein BWQ96_05169 [Gracilariopsis chorda]|uniref:Protein OrfX2/OrfX3/P47 domain-containing protein n=1 Tax=Gracilariopsis chorda TaxID=448386 RepID=A0A2V3ITL3_9FLOR|nr:hypothetical protein BWQ96_05169 [Gracilariopsis chorda]|eukprot:PXF45067.1 hypothetical protein BWQ96_05169 [Gracilariopsis chorda]